MDQIVSGLPSVEPLQHSFVVDDIEADLKQVFIDLFTTYLAERLHDVNVLGMPHLGSMDLVKKLINNDGLVVISNNREEYATRRLYRAWKSINCQGRGLHFLQAYLQQLFPNAWSVSQLMQRIDTLDEFGNPIYGYSYPNELVPIEANPDPAYLTSRVLISISADGENAGSVGDIQGIISAIVPARIVPKVQLLQSSNTDFRIGSFFTCWTIFNTEGTTL